MNFYNKANKELRLEKGNIPNWMIAEQIGVSEGTIIRWLRTELPPDKRLRIKDAIEKIRNEDVTIR